MKRSWLICLALAAACGGESTTLTSPGIPSVTSITVTGSDLMLVGDSVTFTATAAGNTGALTAPRWGSDAPTVATVESYTGRVTAVGTGTATIFVDTNGIRGTKLIRTLPNFGGLWHGEFREIDCQSSGEFVRIQPCDSYWDLGRHITSLTLTQNGDSISGSLRFGPYDVTGSVSPEGTLSLSGTLRNTFNRQLQNVRFELAQNGEMTGTFEELWSSGTISRSGSLRMFLEVRDMVRGRRD